MPSTEASEYEMSKEKPSIESCDLRLTHVFDPDRIESLSTCLDIESAFRHLVGSIARTHDFSPAETKTTIDDLIRREQLVTFALGKGFAFPHVRTRLVNEFVGAIGIAANGIDLGALDGEPTKLVFLVLSPWDQRAGHLQLLSRIVTLADDKAMNIRIQQAMQPDDIWNHLRDIDERTGTSDS